MFVAQQNRDVCMPYMLVMMLLDSRVGRSQFRTESRKSHDSTAVSRKKVS